MVNCMLSLKHATLELMVGLYAQNPGSLSPLADGVPIYTKLQEVSEPPVRG